LNKKELVPGRECGECTLCCIKPTIDCPELKKLSGVRCENLAKTGGCSIYDKRPQTCRDFYCMWRYFPQLGDQWRPDIKGIMLSNMHEGVPDEYADKEAFDFAILTDASIIHDQDFINVLAAFIEQGFPCFISAGKPGHASTKIFLNDYLSSSVSAKNIDLFKNELLKAIEECINHPKEKMQIIDGKIIHL